MESSNHPSWATLLESAVKEPGVISAAYSQFHNYSIGNQLLAWGQCITRGIQPGPMSTFQGWKNKGRYVRKGQKALSLCQPVTVKKQIESTEGSEEAEVLVRFTYRPAWFVLSQTEGQTLPEQTAPAWSKDRALATLNVSETAFDLLDGNTLGYARGRTIAINPANSLKNKTTFHELAHILLGHTAEGIQADGELTPRNLRECEAEAVALLCCAALNLPGVECCRGYIQAWWGTGNAIPERSAQRVLKVADQILKAGTPEAEALS